MDLTEQISQQHRERLQELIREHILLPIDTQRQWQLILALRNELYWRAKQYLTFQVNADGVTLESAIPGARGEDNSQTLAYVFNITRSDGQKFIAVTGARAPRANVVAGDSGDYVEIQRAKDADAVMRWLDDIWNTDQRAKDVARTIFRSGPQFCHQAWVENQDKYGTAEIDVTVEDLVKEPDMFACEACGQQVPVADIPADVPAVCPACGSPMTRMIPGAEYMAPKTTKKKVPRGAPEIHFYTVFEVWLPPKAKNLEEAPWLFFEDEADAAELRSIYGEKITPSMLQEGAMPGDTPAQVVASDAASQIVNDGQDEARRRMFKLRLSRLWLKPSMYWNFPKDMRELFQQMAPEGVRAVFVNGHLIEAVPEKLTDVWSVCKTGTDDRILGDPICHDLIPIQRIVNNFFNLAIETVLRGVPKTVVHPRLLNRAAIKQGDANVAEILFASAGVGEDITKMMQQLPMARMSEQLIPLAELFRQYSREIDGVMEAAFGGGEPAPTWRQDQQRKNAALQQFYMAFEEMKEFWEKTRRNALRLVSKFGVGHISVPPNDPFVFGPRKVDLATVDPEGLRVEMEETLPESHVEESDRLRELLTLPPQVQEMAGVFHPMNVSRVVELLSVRGISSPLEHLMQKTLKTIQKLVESTPISNIDPLTGMPMVDPMTGMPMVPEEPSIQPDPFEDKNAAFVAEVVRAWCNSPAGQEYAIQLPEGYRNVKLFGMVCEQTAMAMMAPMPGEEMAGGVPSPESEPAPAAA